jgi:hypothetical protein
VSITKQDMMNMQDRVALPRIRPRKGFAWLPLPKQLVTISIGAVLVLALLPLLVEPRGTRSLRDALRRPALARVALTRLEQHYQLVWMSTATPAEQAVRGRVLALQAGVLLVGAVAGRAAHAAGRPATTPIRYGTTSRMRARAALDARKDTNHAA